MTYSVHISNTHITLITFNSLFIGHSLFFYINFHNQAYCLQFLSSKHAKLSLLILLFSTYHTVWQHFTQAVSTRHNLISYFLWQEEVPKKNFKSFIQRNRGVSFHKCFRLTYLNVFAKKSLMYIIVIILVLSI